MTDFAPSWTDNVTVVSPAALPRGLVLRGTLDLVGKRGARLMCSIGRGGTTAIGSPINVEIRCLVNNGGFRHVGAVMPYASSTAAAYLKQISNAGGYAIGTTAMVTAAAGTPAADEDVCFWGVAAIPGSVTGLPNLEFGRISKWTAGTNTITMDAPITKAKIYEELWSNRADCFAPVWLEGGSLYEVVFDYGAAASGETVAVVAYAQVYDKDVSS